jgi:hypothetical protein
MIAPRPTAASSGGHELLAFCIGSVTGIAAIMTIAAWKRKGVSKEEAPTPSTQANQR